MNQMEDEPIMLNVGVAYSQICIFRSDLEYSFNDWTQEHIDQYGAADKADLKC